MEINIGDVSLANIVLQLILRSIYNYMTFLGFNVWSIKPSSPAINTFEKVL